MGTWFSYLIRTTTQHLLIFSYPLFFLLSTYVRSPTITTSPISLLFITL